LSGAAVNAPADISTLLLKSTAFLKRKGSLSPRLDAELLLAEVLGVDRIDLYINYRQPLNKAETDRDRELVMARGGGRPVAYILGRAHFRDLTLRVDERVLVPRPETEHLVEEALSFLRGRDWRQPPRLLDLGTGSGAIAISLAASFPDAEVTAADRDAAALELAEENAGAAGLGGRITFIRSDMFQDLDPLTTFDLIASNPPYVSDEEWGSLPRDIRDFEPETALRGGADGLDFHRLLAAESHRYLRPGGRLLLEIGSGQGEAVTGLLTGNGAYSRVEVTRDYAGNDRVVTAERAADESF